MPGTIVFLVDYAVSGPGHMSDVRFRSVCSSYESALDFSRAESTADLRSHCERNDLKVAHVIRETTLDSGALGQAWYVDLNGQVHDEWPHHSH